MKTIKSIRVELMFLVVALFIGFAANINPAYGFGAGANIYPYPTGYPTPYPGPASSIIYVKWNASTPWNNGSSWTEAYIDLQSALSAASSGDEIWVAAGTYYPTSDPIYPTPGTDRTISFELKNGVAIYGGFAGTETLLAERDLETNVTILSGDIGVANNNSDNSYHVVVGSGTNDTAILDGFTITGGNANGTPPNSNGGGMYNNSGNPTLKDVIFVNNYGNFGGGMFNAYSNPALLNVTFNGNSAPTSTGGGMYNFQSNPSLTNMTFSNNSADYGGGIFNDSSSPTLEGVTFSGNSVFYFGGGMYNYIYSGPSLTNVTFSGNSADSGSAVFNDISGPLLRNVTISGNIASIGGGSVYNYTDASTAPSILNSIIWGNTGGEIVNSNSDTPIIGYSVVEGGCPPGGDCTNIITTDPMFGILGNNGGLTETIPLLAGSSAIDAGDDTNCPSTDQRGVTRPQGSHCDIGAYELAGGTLPTEPTFGDVPTSHPYWQYIEILYANGYTGGCSVTPLNFCPDVIMDRAQSAVFMLRGNFGSGYVPVTPSHFFKDNWSQANWAEGWAESMYIEGLTAGCSASPLKFCPYDKLTNVQLAVFGLRLKHGMAYPTPTATGIVFEDMTDVGFWGTGWAEQAYAEGLIPSCGTDTGSGLPLFCPNALVSRGFGASVIVNAKGLTMP